MKIDLELIIKACEGIKPELVGMKISENSNLISDLNFESISLIALTIELENITNKDLSQHASEMLEIKTVADVIRVISKLC